LSNLKGDATEKELIAFCRERLAAYKCPKSVDISGRAARNPTGKILKKICASRSGRAGGPRDGLAWSVSPPLDDLLDRLHVVALPMRVRFRGITVREVALIDGPPGWGDFGAFLEYQPPEGRALARRGHRSRLR